MINLQFRRDLPNFTLAFSDLEAFKLGEVLQHTLSGEDPPDEELGDPAETMPEVGDAIPWECGVEEGWAEVLSTDPNGPTPSFIWKII